MENKCINILRTALDEHVTQIIMEAIVSTLGPNYWESCLNILNDISTRVEYNVDQYEDIKCLDISKLIYLLAPAGGIKGIWNQMKEEYPDLDFSDIISIRELRNELAHLSPNNSDSFDYNRVKKELRHICWTLQPMEPSIKANMSILFEALEKCPKTHLISNEFKNHENNSLDIINFNTSDGFENIKIDRFFNAKELRRFAEDKETVKTDEFYAKNKDGFDLLMFEIIEEARKGGREIRITFYSDLSPLKNGNNTPAKKWLASNYSDNENLDLISSYLKRNNYKAEIVTKRANVTFPEWKNLKVSW